MSQRGVPARATPLLPYHRHVSKGCTGTQPCATALREGVGSHIGPCHAVPCRSVAQRRWEPYRTVSCRAMPRQARCDSVARRRWRDRKKNGNEGWHQTTTLHCSVNIPQSFTMHFIHVHTQQRFWPAGTRCACAMPQALDGLYFPQTTPYPSSLQLLDGILLLKIKLSTQTGNTVYWVQPGPPSALYVIGAIYSLLMKGCISLSEKKFNQQKGIFHSIQGYISLSKTRLNKRGLGLPPKPAPTTSTSMSSTMGGRACDRAIGAWC